MDHMIQIGGVGPPDEPFMEGWTVLSALAAVTSRIRVATLAMSVGYRNPAHLAKIAERRATFQGRYFHAEDAILEPKPVQKPRPPVMIAGGGERLTLRAVARLANAYNIGGDPEMVKDKLAVLHCHCDTARRDYRAIEKTHNHSWLLNRDEAGINASVNVCPGAVRFGVLSVPCPKPST
jgi:alkanesulfonate monooxygenase SsuD/methylene tetrahydromethanopterin reductase-like flavin-dependent oxidoreductase (luciferase family)